jgi:hypothetical protein
VTSKVLWQAAKGPLVLSRNAQAVSAAVVVPEHGSGGLVVKSAHGPKKLVSFVTLTGAKSGGENVEVSFDASRSLLPQIPSILLKYFLAGRDRETLAEFTCHVRWTSLFKMRVK